MQNVHALIHPILALVVWSLVMWCWMYATRIPAILKARIKFNPDALRGEQLNVLPASVRWKSDNYSNLNEQPTIFYALALTLVLMGDTSQLNQILAWAYVGLRVVHSLIHALGNIVILRFSAFFVSGLVLIAMILNTLANIYL